MTTDIQTGKKVKKTLTYSPMTDRVYYINGRGEKIDFTDSFYYVLGAMVDNTEKGFKLDYTKAGFRLYAVKTPIEEDRKVLTLNREEAEVLYKYLAEAEDYWYDDGVSDEADSLSHRLEKIIGD